MSVAVARQYRDATHESLAFGVIPKTIRLPIDIQQALVEDDNCYFIDLSYERLGVNVLVSVGCYHIDYYCALTTERALLYAGAA